MPGEGKREMPLVEPTTLAVGLVLFLLTHLWPTATVL
jgi:hypothetical protein